MQFGSDSEALKHHTSGGIPLCLTCAIQRSLFEYLRCRVAHADVATSTYPGILMKERAEVNENDQLLLRF